MTYYYKGYNIANFVDGSSTTTDISNILTRIFEGGGVISSNYYSVVYYKFPGTENNTTETILKPLDFMYKFLNFTETQDYDGGITPPSATSASVHTLRNAAYQDFNYLTSSTTQQSLNAPAGTTHISAIVIGGGGGGGRGGNSGGGLNGIGGGSGGTGGQGFLYKYTYNSNLKVVVGSGGAAGTNGVKSYITNGSTEIITANGGSLGTNGTTTVAGVGGNGGSVTTVSGTQVYVPASNCTKNTGLKGNNGSGRTGGSMKSLLFLNDIGNIYGSNSGAGGSGGLGGIAGGIASAAFGSNGNQGSSGFVRVFYLIE
jgi:hypothetical protein